MQQEYDTYRFQTLPAAMQSAGVLSVTTSDGHNIEVKNKFYCNPNKNDNDRKVIGEWLKKYGAEHLIKKMALVDGAQLDELKETGVPYVEKWDMNTNSLKAWIKDQLGLGKAGVAQISTSDIPECIHFIQVDEVELTA
jgi:translation initiation factor 2 alpha subunit (eIF-2alpha)